MGGRSGAGRPHRGGLKASLESSGAQSYSGAHSYSGANNLGSSLGGGGSSFTAGGLLGSSLGGQQVGPGRCCWAVGWEGAAPWCSQSLALRGNWDGKVLPSMRN